MDGRPSSETLLLAVAERDRAPSVRSTNAKPDGSVVVLSTHQTEDVGGRVRDQVEHVEPSLEDAYLLLRGGPLQTEPAEEVTS
jgi:hypothetical protein